MFYKHRYTIGDNIKNIVMDISAVWAHSQNDFFNNRFVNNIIRTNKASLKEQSDL